VTAPALYVVIVAAGEGSRLGGGERKAAVEVGGEPLAGRALRALADSPGAIGGALVVHPGDLERARRDWVPGFGGALPWQVVPGGARRPDSVAAGLSIAPEGAELFLVHDAARPLLDRADRDAVIAAAVAHGAAILAEPVADTLKRAEGDLIVEEIDRSGVWGAQTPQVFTRASFELARGVGPPSGTDEAGWLARGGVAVRVVVPRSPNPKVTRAADLALVEALLAARRRR